MLLFESFNELHKIDRSILYQLFSSTNSSEKSKLKYLDSYYTISPNSKIYVDNLKRTEDGRSIHTWKYATEEVLERGDVSGIILRSNKRQLLGIFKRGSDYKLFPSEIATDLNNFDSINLSRYGSSSTTSLISVRNKMAGLVKAFIEEHPNAKKNWDIMIVMKDKSVAQLKSDRQDARKDKEIKPSEKGYDDYIRKLKDNLSKRLEIFVNNRLKNIGTEQELKDILNNNPNIFVKKIKIAGIIFSLEDMSADISRSNERFNAVATYKINNPPNYNGRDYYYSFTEVRQLTVVFALEGKQLKLDSIYFRPSKYTFDEGMRYILEKKEEYDIK